MAQIDYTFDDVLLELGLEEDILMRDYEAKKELNQSKDTIVVSVFTNGQSYTGMFADADEANEYVKSIVGESISETAKSHLAAKDNKTLFRILEVIPNPDKIYMYSKGQMIIFDTFQEMVATMFTINLGYGAVSFDGDSVHSFTTQEQLASLVMANFQLGN